MLRPSPPFSETVRSRNLITSGRVRARVLPERRDRIRAALKRLLGINKSVLSELAHKDIIKRAQKRGAFKLEPSVSGYCAQLREQASARGGESGADARVWLSSQSSLLSHWLLSRKGQARGYCVLPGFAYRRFGRRIRGAILACQAAGRPGDGGTGRSRCASDLTDAPLAAIIQGCVSDAVWVLLLPNAGFRHLDTKEERNSHFSAREVIADALGGPDIEPSMGVA